MESQFIMGIASFHSIGGTYNVSASMVCTIGSGRLRTRTVVTNS